MYQMLIVDRLYSVIFPFFQRESVFFETLRIGNFLLAPCLLDGLQVLKIYISELAQTGDYLTFNLAKERAVLVRDESGEIHAFHNVCRDRKSVV